MEKLTKNKLIGMCKELDLKGYSGLNKKDLVEFVAIAIMRRINDLNNSNQDIPTNDIAVFINQTMLTCIGNKRKLARNIGDIVREIAESIGKQKLNILDAFAGSCVVSRELSYWSENLYVNDLEYYSYLMACCYVQTPSEENKVLIRHHINQMNILAKEGPYKPGIICKLYAPQETNNIKLGERCFYTRENALIIDTLRDYIETSTPKELFCYLVVPLLNRASIHTNTSGVFKGFYKSGELGCFGGTGKNALPRILKNIELECPIWNGTWATCYNQDINKLELPDDLDVIYIDPPYNQHPYGSNYFMLNVIAKNIEPENISRVSGIPANWNKSNYNNKKGAIESMRSLISEGLKKSKCLLISYNNEGLITDEDWAELFKDLSVQQFEIEYATFKGSRNLANRNKKVMEIMFLVCLP